MSSKYLNTLVFLPIGSVASPESKPSGCAELNVAPDFLRFPQTCSTTSLAVQWQRKKNNALQLTLYDPVGNELSTLCIQACEFRWKCLVPADQIPVDCVQPPPPPLICTSTSFVKVLQINALNIQLLTNYVVFEKAAYDYLGISISTHNLLTDAEKRTSLLQNYVYQYNLIFQLFCLLVNFLKNTDLPCFDALQCVWKQVSGLKTDLTLPIVNDFILFENSVFEDFLKMRLVGIMALCNAGKNLIPSPTNCPLPSSPISMAPQLMNTLVLIPIGPTGGTKYPELEEKGCAELDIGLDQIHFPLSGQQVANNPLYPRVSQKPLLISWKKINGFLELTLYDNSGCVIGKLSIPEGEYGWRCVDDCKNLTPVECSSSPSSDGLQLGYDKILQINILNPQLLANYVQFESFAYYTLFSTINIHNYLGDAERQTNLIQRVLDHNDLVTKLFQTLIQFKLKSPGCFTLIDDLWSVFGLSIYGPLTEELINSAIAFHQTVYQDFLKMRTVGLLDLCNVGIASTIPIRIQNSNFNVERKYGCDKPGLTQLFSQNNKNRK